MANQWTGQSIQICDDGAEFAPLTYYKRDGGDKTKELIGSTVELIDLIFSKHNIRYQITLLPWKRCLHEAKYGKNFQLILNAVHTKERAEDYLLTSLTLIAKNIISTVNQSIHKVLQSILIEILNSIHSVVFAVTRKLFLVLKMVRLNFIPILTAI